ncbi:Na+/H+ antiporter NhaA [Rhodococcoides kyotonense]|nr:Na+/H+ antiporter NhaA [Rhodococcus kyotonensis]
MLHNEKTGGALLLVATVAALVWANSPAGETYTVLRETAVGPDALQLHLTLGQWAADGLLAIFFFVVGLELKQEFVVGSLKRPRVAAIPVIAAVGGVLVPAGIYLAVNVAAADGAVEGWAVPAATDIAFAVTILAVVGSHLPSPLRVFLLTLAVVDDLLAITIIAIGYTDDVSATALALSAVPLAAFGALTRRGVTRWWVLVPLALTTWTLMHASGIHATVAGVLLALTVPVRPARRSTVPSRISTTERGLSGLFAERLQPWSSCVAVPVFAFFAAGVAVGGIDGLRQSFVDPVTIGIVLALVVGKPVGILSATFGMSRLPGMRLDAALRWRDLTGVAILAGIGFTVSLLIGELAFGVGSAREEHVKVGVLSASLLAAVIASSYLAVRNRSYESATTQRNQGKSGATVTLD